MPYCSYVEVLLHAPQAQEGETFAGYIEQADRVIDAKLRSSFEVPFTDPVPGLVVNISSKLTAAAYLKALYSKIHTDAPDYATAIYEEAMAELQEVIANPSLLGIPTRLITTAEDELGNEVTVAGSGDGYFNMGDETQWGRPAKPSREQT